MKPALARAVAGVPAPRILDCGCGTGSNLEMLRPYGRAVGFDLTATGVRFARAHGQTVAQASIAAIPFRSGTFDLVTSFDVFQCLPDDGRALGHRRDGARAEAGRLAAACTSPRSRSCTASIRCCRRKCGATRRRRLRSIVEQGGFQIDRLTFDHMSLLPLMLPVRMWHRATAAGGQVTAGEAEIAVPIAPVNAALTALVSLEALALRAVNMPIGSSLMCLARKAQRLKPRPSDF